MTKAAIQAIRHCPKTTPIPHFIPSSLLIEAIAATHGVYSKQKTSKQITDNGVKSVNN